MIYTILRYSQYYDAFLCVGGLTATGIEHAVRTIGGRVSSTIKMNLDGKIMDCYEVQVEALNPDRQMVQTTVVVRERVPAHIPSWMITLVDDRDSFLEAFQQSFRIN